MQAQVNVKMQARAQVQMKMQTHVRSIDDGDG